MSTKTTPPPAEPDPELLRWLDEPKGHPRKARPQSRFPTDDMLAEYVRVIDIFSDGNVFALLRRLLIHTGNLGVDEGRLEHLARLERSEPQVYASLLETDAV